MITIFLLKKTYLYLHSIPKGVMAGLPETWEDSGVESIDVDTVPVGSGYDVRWARFCEMTNSRTTWSGSSKASKPHTIAYLSINTTHGQWPTIFPALPILSHLCPIAILCFLTKTWTSVESTKQTVLCSITPLIFSSAYNCLPHLAIFL